MPACSVISVKISLEAEAVPGMDAVFQNATANIRKIIGAIVLVLGIEIQSRLRAISQ
jgi:copper chaperone CopZ